MASVEDRVVRIEFDNAAFERNINTTLASLAKLDKAMDFKGAASGLNGLQNAGSKIDLSHIASSIDNISSKFHAMGAVAFTVIQSMTRGVLGFAKKVGGDILDPIIGGGTKRAKNIEQAKFMFEGLGIDVEKGMDSALKAVKGTAYGLDEAAKAAAQFGASGVKVGDEMTGALKGVAGAAAMTGTSFTEMADIFAGSAGTGKVTNMDLMQFATRGLNAAASVGKVLGKTEAQVHEMATKGTLDFKTFAGAMNEAFGSHATEANKTFSGSLANMKAALARLGAAFIGPGLTQMRDIFNALTPVIDDVTTALKPLMNTILGITQMVSGSLIKQLKGLDFSNLVKAMPNFQKALLNTFEALGRVFNVVKKSFRDIFPKSTTSTIVAISNAVLNFSKMLLMGGETASKLRRIFDGFFAVLSIGWTIIKEGAKFIGSLATELFGLSKGGFLDFAVKMGDFFTNLQQDLVKGKGIHDFFVMLKDAIKQPISFLKDLGDAIKNFFTGFDPSIPKKMGDGLGRIGDRFQSLKDMLRGAQNFFAPLISALQRAWGIIQTIGGAIGRWFKGLGQAIADAMGKGDFSAVLDAINVGLLGGIAALIAKWMHKGINVDLTGGVMQSLTGTFNQLTNTLKAMQMQVKAKAIMKIAEAIAVLTASVLVLSLIDSAALTKALTAMAVGFGQLLASFAILDKMSSGTAGAARFTLITAGMIAMATAMLILGGALKILATISWGDLAKGMVAMVGILAIMIGASKGLEKASVGLIIGGVGLTAMGIALTILAGAVALFGQMNLLTMGKGLLGIAGALVAIALGMNMMPVTLPITGAGLILVATGLTVLAGALKLMSMLSWGEMAKGFVGIGGGLLIIAGAMQLMPINLPITAAGLLLVAVAMNVLGGALKLMGSMSWGEIAKGLVAMAGALLILAVAAYAMSGSILGAVAIGVMAVSLKVLAEALTAFAALSWGDLLHGLVGIAAALALLAVAALALSPVIPEMLALGAALVVLGAGFALIGVAAYLVGKGLESIAKAGPTAAKALTSVLYAIGEAIPKLVQGFAQGLVDLIMIIGKALPAIAKILGAVLNYLADGLIKLVPKLIQIIGQLLEGIIKLIIEKGPELIAAGLGLLINLLTGIRDNMDQITTLVIEIYLQFMQALTDNMDQIVGAGVDLLVAFLQGISDNLIKIVDTVAEIITKFVDELALKYVDLITAGVNALIAFLQGITDNLIKITNAVGQMVTTFITALTANGVRIANAATNMIITFITSIGNNGFRIGAAAADAIVKFINGISANMQKIINAGTNLIVQFMEGIGRSINRVIDKGVEVIGKFLEGLGKNAVKLANKAGDVLVDFLNGMADAIRTHTKEIQDAGRNIAGAIIDGLTGGLASKAGDVANKVKDMASGAVHKAKSFLKVVGDPYSLVFMGIGESMANGMTMALDADTSVEDSSVGLVSRATDVFRNSLSTITDSLGDVSEFNPTITPVLDLSEVALGAAKISSYIQDSQSLTPSFSTAQANTIASGVLAAKTDTAATSATTGDVKFEQNIYAPEQLSTADIYKQTRNQITLAKEELKIP